MACCAPSWADATTGLQMFRDGRLAEAVTEWERGAGAGDAQSLLYLASAYDAGTGVPQDFDRAMALYQASAAQGNAAAALDVGLMYDAGRGAPRNPATAARWYARAAKLGSGRAAYNLGLILEQGDGVPRDARGAIAAYRRALSLGIPAASHRLAALEPRQTARPIPLPPAPVPARGDDFVDAQQALMSQGLSPDAVSRLTDAAAKGDAKAAFDLGYAFEHGIGGKTDLALSLLWYTEAASGKDPRAAQLAHQALDRLHKQINSHH